MSEQIQESQSEKWRQLSHLGWQIKNAVFSVMYTGQGPESFQEYYNSYFKAGNNEEVFDSKTVAENAIKKANEILLKFTGGEKSDGAV